jgi:hypothetical protein
VKTELPITYKVTAANYDEKKAMCAMIGEQMKKPLEATDYLLLDRGYDSTEMIRIAKEAGIIPIIDIRNCWKDSEATKQYKDTDIVYNYKGEVFYVEQDGKQVKMAYEGYDRQKKCLRYSHNSRIHKIYISYDERVFLPVARDSKKFKRLYKGRTAVERLNGRMDRDYMFENHCIRGLKKMELLVGLTFIIMNENGNREDRKQ